MRTRWLTVLLGCCIVTEANGYSVLTHEAIIDSAWKDNIQPLLLKRFPDASPDDLRKAHAYTYGGAIIQDMGYYPFGHKFVSDLAHYVRSGDLILNLLAEATDLTPAEQATKIKAMEADIVTWQREVENAQYVEDSAKKLRKAPRSQGSCHSRRGVS